MMPCLCQYFSKDKYNNINSNNNNNNNNKIDNQIIEISSTSSFTSNKISASEVAALKAEVWTLKSSVSESVIATNNMQDVLANTVQEKYELIEELNEANCSNEKLKMQLMAEREMHANERKKLLNEIYMLKNKLDETSTIFEKVSQQNFEIKQSLFDANNTIYKMGIMFLKMKNTKNSIKKDEQINN